MKKHNSSKTENKLIWNKVCAFVSLLFKEYHLKHSALNKNAHYSPTKRQLHKKLIFNKSIEYKTDHHSSMKSHTNPKDSTKLNNPISKPNLNQSLENSYDINSGKGAMIEKEMKEYLKRVVLFNNRIKALTLHEYELSIKMAQKENKEKMLENVIREKKLLKETLMKAQMKKKNDEEMKREKATLSKLTHHEKIEQGKKNRKDKIKQAYESSKADQSIMKEIFAQTLIIEDKTKKIKNYQIKEAEEQARADEILHNKKIKKQKKQVIYEKLKDNNEKLIELKKKCLELEKIEENCMHKLMTTKLRSFNHSINPAFKSTITNNMIEKNEDDEHYYNFNNNNISLKNSYEERNDPSVSEKSSKKSESIKKSNFPKKRIFNCKENSHSNKKSQDRSNSIKNTNKNKKYCHLSLKKIHQENKRLYSVDRKLSTEYNEKYQHFKLNYKSNKQKKI